MTPPASFVTDLAAYDPLLRVRFSRHRAAVGKPLWIIERKAEHTPPHAAHLKALDLSRTKVLRACAHVASVAACSACRKALGRARTKDLWEGMKDGWAHVMDVHPSLLSWSQVAPTLTKADAWRQGGLGAIARQFEAQDDADEQRRERHAQNVISTNLQGVWDDVQWKAKRRISTYVPDGGGFTVTDRRAVSV